MPQQATDGRFFTIFPDAFAATRIAQLAHQLRSEYGLHGAPLRTDRCHVTLHHLWQLRGASAGHRCPGEPAGCSGAMPRFNIGFNRVASFSSAPRNRPFLVLGNDGVD